MGRATDWFEEAVSFAMLSDDTNGVSNKAQTCESDAQQMNELRFLSNCF